MNILYYKDLDYSKVKKQFKKTVDQLKSGDFASAEIKKMVNTGFYRAKLDYENRLLFKFATYSGQTYILLLEVIYNHDYDKSRFLRGAKIDDNKLEVLKSPDKVPVDHLVDLCYVNPKSVHFHLLDKVISFDESQEDIFKVTPPVIIIGSAGSGKTALTLEKLKALKGNVLYVTLSPFLVENSAALYYSNNYNNDKQDVDFLSYKEFLETHKIINGREIDYNTFENWAHPRSQAFGIKDPYKVFEEFKGVITGKDITKEFLSREDYLGLGIKQSIFLAEERDKIYTVFQKFLQFLTENNLYDINMVSYRWLEYCKPKYDFIVIDEVQDFTNIQLYLILKTLKNQENFVLCGDSNQNVHPNFFSWTNVKTMFYQHELSGNEVRILRTNYRNSLGVTEIANKLLKIKNARFGSIDKESTYLVDSVSANNGKVSLLKDNPKIRKQLNDKTRRSTQYAVLVMNSDDKIEARKIFKTPLIFSVQEAKGLEYKNIIILKFVGGYNREFREITRAISSKHLSDDAFVYSRVKDKSDKSLDAYKFYINSLYVAITRAVESLYILEPTDKHDLWHLLDLAETKEKVSLKEEVSSMDDWKKEAQRLEKQGKKEQAEEIRKSILEVQTPGWEPITPDNVDELKKQALDPLHFNKKQKDLFFAYSLLSNDIESINKLSELKYRKADNYEHERNSIYRKYYSQYESDNVKSVEQNIKKYGVNYRDQFNLTPLLAAVQSGSFKIMNFLAQYGADSSLTDNFGKNALQVVLQQSYFKNGFIDKLEQLYPCLLTENIKVKVDDRLVKIDNHKIEYFLVNFFISLQSAIVANNKKQWLPKGLAAGDIEQAVANYPETVLMEYRKKRTYISANLSKNEIEGSNPYNKKLFYRVSRGYYVLNPEMDVMINDKWKNTYDLMQIPKDKKWKKRADNKTRSKSEKHPSDSSISNNSIKEKQLNREKTRLEKNNNQLKEEKKELPEQQQKTTNEKQFKLPFD